MLRIPNVASPRRRVLVAVLAFAVGAVGLAETVEAAGPCGADQEVRIGGVVLCAHTDHADDLRGGPAAQGLVGHATERAAQRSAVGGRRTARFDLAAADTPGAGADGDLQLVCDRTSSRRRVEVLYAHPVGANRLSEVRAELEGHVRFAQLQYDFSAFVARSDRAYVPRFVTEGSGEDCRVRISPVQLSSTALSDIDAFFNELVAKGYDDPDRAYLVFAEDGPYCGVGTIVPDDDDPDPRTNRNNARQAPAFARIDEPCWGFAEAHELGHNLGAVQFSAPHSTRGSHCTDGYDAMCYPDGTQGSTAYQEASCPEKLLYFALDCNNDDYYDPSPAPGSYLDTHWNIVDNDWLLETFTDAAVVGLTVGPTGTRFDDVVLDNTFVRDIDDLARNGVTKGCNPPANTRFCPGDPVTRQEMAAFLRRALGLPAGTSSFSDVPASNTFRADITALADAGITRGCNPPANTKFCPGDPVTRQEMAAFLNRTGLLTR